MAKESAPKDDSPYRLLDLATKFEPILNPDDTMKESRNVPRAIPEIETTIVNDTNRVIAIFNGELTKSPHFIDGKSRYPGSVDACIYLDQISSPCLRHCRPVMELSLCNLQRSFPFTVIS